MKKQRIRWFAGTLVLVLLFLQIPFQVSAWDGTSMAEPDLQDGVYQISSAEEFYWFAQELGAGRSRDAALTGDINLNNQPWTAMGSTSSPYAGTFDGNGYAVSGLSVTAGSAWGGALFASVSGTVRNLTVSGSLTSSLAGMGGIAAQNTGGLIENCRSLVTITNTGALRDNIGGVVGQNTAGGIIQNSVFEGTITAVTETSGGKHVGGIVGQNVGSTISGCVNLGTIESGAMNAAGWVGGIAGYLTHSGAYQTTAIYNCYNLGDVTGGGVNTNVGGIVGAAVPGSGTMTLVNCYQAGTVSGTKAGDLISAVPGGAFQMANNYFFAGGTDDSTGAMTQAEMQSANFAGKLNAESGAQFGLTIAETQLYVGKDGAYPLLAWQSDETVQTVPVQSVVISGTAKAGETLQAVAYGADGKLATDVEYQWLVSEDNQTFKPIAGETASILTLNESDVGTYLAVEVSGAEDSFAASEPVGPVEKSDAVKVAEDKDALFLPVTGVIREAVVLPLPAAGQNGTEITWESAAPAYLDAGTGAIVLPDAGVETVILTATISYGAASDTKQFIFMIYSLEATQTEEDAAYLQRAKEALEGTWYTLRPVYGTNANVIPLVEAELERLGFADVGVSITNTNKPDSIAEDGSISYFYADPNGTRFQGWFESVSLTFALTKNGAAVSHSKNATIYWNQDQVKETMEAELLSYVTEDRIKDGNASLAAVDSDLLLPKIADGKKYAEIEWTSSNPDAIEIDASKQNGADQYYEPYLGKVKQGTQPQTVTLTAIYTFNYTSMYEAEITLMQTFTVTVKALEVDVEAEMQELLDTHYTAEKLLAYGTETPIDPQNVKTDLQLPIPRNTGIPSYWDYSFSVSSGNSDVIDISYYRAYVYRPLPGAQPETVKLTVTMTSNEVNVSATKKIVLIVQPLTDAEIAAETALMEQVKASYFSGLNRGANASQSAITMDLSAFQQAVADGSGGIRWIYTQAEAGPSGISPVSIDPGRPSESWDRFHSSRPLVISHENLLVTQPAYDTQVTITSCLSSTAYARYAELYPERADFAALSRQSVSTTVTVLGANGAGTGEEKQLNGTFTLIGDTVHGGGAHVSYPTWIDASPYTARTGETVMDVFQRTLADYGYSYVGNSYITSITTPGGLTLAAGANGPDSGWLYFVNGRLGKAYADQYLLEDGDEILWLYTDDYLSDSRVENDVMIDANAPLPDYPAQWYNFRGSDANNGITQAKTARNAGEASLLWQTQLRDAEDWTKHVSDPILVNGNIYIAVGDQIQIIDGQGEVRRSGVLATNIDYTCRLVYADGRIVVPLRDGRLQALSADTLTTVWISEALPEMDGFAHQSLSTVTYADGYFYTGTACADYSSTYYGVYQCIEAVSGQIVWQYVNENAGYYWSGAATFGNALVFAGDDGVLTSLDAKTGALLDTEDLGAPVRATVVKEGNFAVVTSADGRLHKTVVNEDGSFGAVSSVSFADSSTSTPAIYDGYAYVGGAFGAAYDYLGILAVIDLNTMKLQQYVTAPAEVKSAPLLSVGYDGGVYAYFTANTEPGGVYVMELGVKEETAQTLFAPSGNAANYCMASVLSDEAGTLYYTNDSGALFAIAKNGSGGMDGTGEGSETPGNPGTGDLFSAWMLWIPAAFALVLFGVRPKKQRV